MKKQASSIFYIMLIICTTILLSACAPKPVFDVTEVDFIAMNLPSNQLSFEGIRLGMSFAEVNEVKGYPKEVEEFAAYNIVNYYYANGEDTEMIVNFINDTVARITLDKSYDDKLINTSKFYRNKRQMYTDFGVADNLIDQPPMTRYIYYAQGREIILRRDQHVGYSFVNPSKVPKKQVVTTDG